MTFWLFEKSLTKVLGVLRGDFWGFGCPNNTQTPCWLNRLWWNFSLWRYEHLLMWKQFPNPICIFYLMKRPLRCEHLLMWTQFPSPTGIFYIMQETFYFERRTLLPWSQGVHISEVSLYIGFVKWSRFNFCSIFISTLLSIVTIEKNNTKEYMCRHLGSDLCFIFQIPSLSDCQNYKLILYLIWPYESWLEFDTIKRYRYCYRYRFKKCCMASFYSLTLLMLRLLLSKAKGRKDYCKQSKPCHVGIHWKALAEYSQMSTHVAGFLWFFMFFASLCIGKISQQQHKHYMYS